MPLILINYGHFLGLAGLSAALVAELVLFRPQVRGAVARRLARADAAYGFSALLSLGTGLLKLFAGDKPASYFGANPLFHVKVTLFVVILALSVYPTVQFMRRRRAAPGDEIVYPGRVGVFLRVELFLLATIPLFGTLIARGYGY